MTVVFGPGGISRRGGHPSILLVVLRGRRKSSRPRRMNRRTNPKGVSQIGQTLQADLSELGLPRVLCRFAFNGRVPSKEPIFAGTAGEKIDRAIPEESLLNAARVERRLAAIMVADVVGYSRLMGQDEIGTLARLRDHRDQVIRPKIARHKGRIVRTAGDSFLVVFPSVVEAVACAVEIQLEMAECNAMTLAEHNVVLRIGINLGDIIIENAEIHGDGVNVAVRLEPLAEPGGICVSAIVHDEIRDKLDLAFDDMGEHLLKNIARARRVYRILLGKPTSSSETSIPDVSAAEPQCAIE